MLFSPVVDGFVEGCSDNRRLSVAFVSVGVILWAWSFVAGIDVLSCYVPRIGGFGSSDAVTLLCIYVLTRIIRRLGIPDRLKNHMKWVGLIFVVSGLFVALGFRHCNSVFAFCFAFSSLLIVRKIGVTYRVARVMNAIVPSLFSVYLLHMPFQSYFAGWEQSIYRALPLPHPVCQFLLALLVFVVAIALDMPRRVIVISCEHIRHRLISNLKR